MHVYTKPHMYTYHIINYTHIIYNTFYYKLGNFLYFFEENVNALIDEVL